MTRLEFYVAGISNFSKAFIVYCRHVVFHHQLQPLEAPPDVNCKLQTRPLDRGRETISGLQFPMKNLML